MTTAWQQVEVRGIIKIPGLSGVVVTVTSLLFKGEGRRDPVDEIRHELNPDSPCQPSQS
jgi:hypothetical protein